MRTAMLVIIGCSMLLGGCCYSVEAMCDLEMVPAPPSEVPVHSASGVRRQTVPEPSRARLVRDSLFAAVRAALEATARAQEQLRIAHGTFTADVDRLAELAGYDTASAVVVRIEFASESSWSASATHPQLRGHSCVISAGSGHAPRIHTMRDKRPGHTDPGRVVCDADHARV